MAGTRRPSLFRLDSEGPILDYSELELTDDHIHEWMLLCERCFSEKENPPSGSYFLRTCRADQLLGECRIFVARERTAHTLISAVRTISKKLWNGDNFVDLIGIADVCTLKSGRGFGVGGRVLRLALSACRLEGHTSFVLHSNEKYHSFYSKLGFHMHRSRWSCAYLAVDGDIIESLSRKLALGYEIICADNENVTAVSRQLAGLSNEACRRFNLLGNVQKTAEYFEKRLSISPLMSNEQGGRVYCLCDKSYVSDSTTIDSVASLRGIRAYLTTIYRPEDLSLRVVDLGLDGILMDNFSEYLLFFMTQIFENELSTSSSTISVSGKYKTISLMRVQVPVAIGAMLSGSGLFSVSSSEADNGWMMLTDDLQLRDTFDCEFSIWPVDNF